MPRTSLLAAAGVCLSCVVASAQSGASSASDAGPAPEAVATVDGRPVQAEEFRRRYIRYLLRTGTHDSDRQRREFLNSVVAAHLVVRAAVDAGIEQEEAYRAATARIRQKLLLDAYAERVLFDTLTVTEGELREMFVRSRTTLTARHLYARTRAEAEALSARLDAGASFEDLAREVFADPGLAASGGSVGTFTVDEMDPAFEDAAFALEVGERSGPVRTETGYSIIEVQDRFAPPLLTETEYAGQRGKMEQLVRVRKRRAARSALTRRLADELDVRFEHQALERALARAGDVDPGEDVEDVSDGMPLATYTRDGARRTWTLADFRRASATASEERLRRLVSADDLAEYVRGLLVREALLAEAEAAGVDELPELEQAYAQSVRDWIRETATERLLRTVEVPDDSAAAYFARHGDEFVEPETVEVWEMAVETRAEAERLRALLDRGAASFEDLARRHSMRPGADATGGFMGWVRRDQAGQLADTLFAAPPGAVLGPIPVVGRQVLLLRGDRREARPMPLEAALPEIRRRLHDRYARERLGAHLDALRGRYAVDLHTDTLYGLALIPG